MRTIFSAIQLFVFCPVLYTICVHLLGVVDVVLYIIVPVLITEVGSWKEGGGRGVQPSVSPPSPQDTPPNGTLTSAGHPPGQGKLPVYNFHKVPNHFLARTEPIL